MLTTIPWKITKTEPQNLIYNSSVLNLNMNDYLLTLKSAFLRTSSVVVSNSSFLVGSHTPGFLISRSCIEKLQVKMESSQLYATEETVQFWQRINVSALNCIERRLAISLTFSQLRARTHTNTHAHILVSYAEKQLSIERVNLAYLYIIYGCMHDCILHNVVCELQDVGEGRSIKRYDKKKR